MDDFELPEDLEDVEIIYSDGEDEEPIEDADEEPENATEDDDETLEVDVVDLSILTFQKHTKSVFCSDLSHDNQLVITGSEDDMAYLWLAATSEILFECTGHKDSVTEVCFSYDDQYVATGDMAGMIQVWSVKEKKLVWCFEGGDDLNWLFWHPMTNVLFGGVNSGEVYIWQIPQGNCKVLPSPYNSYTGAAKILPNGKQILVGYQDGQLKLWNIKDCKADWSSKLQLSITNIDINKEGTLAIVAPESALIKLNDGKNLITLLPPGENMIETSLFHTELGIVATGALSGQLCVWELGRHSLRHQAKLECSVTIMKWGLGEKIFIGGNDGAVYVCDVKTGVLLETLTGHKAGILSISVFKDNRILTASDDGTVKIFNIKN